MMAYYSKCLLVSLLLVATESAPYFMLKNSRPFCVTVDSPRSTELLLTYDAPDMVIIPPDDSEKVEGNTEVDPKDGLDQKFNQRYKEKLETMKRKSKNLNDMSIVMYQRGETGTADREWRRRSREEQGGRDRFGSGRLRQELTERQGTIKYRTGDIDGPVEICAQSMSATSAAPSRISFNVTEFVAQQADTEKQQSSKDEANSEGQEKAKKEFTRMAGDLIGLERKVKLLLNNADYAKDQEAKFHEQSLAMNRASQYWPIIHLLVLLVTGFTQANHIVRFFKSRHIY